MIYYSNTNELIILLIQLICYINSYFLNIFVFKPSNPLIILFFNLLYIKSLSSLYFANQTHKQVQKQKINIQKKDLKQFDRHQYCKNCKVYIENRDHHCIYIGRCVEKANYQYFFSYIIFSYTLSFIGICQIYLNFSFIELCYNKDQLTYTIHFIFSIITHLFFVIFTAGLLATSIRSIIEGVYVVDQIKSKKMVFKRSTKQFFHACFTISGIKNLYKQFKQNWKKMVGQDIGFLNIFLLI